jgi:NAD(P)H-dependent FMN reductase
MFDTHAGIMELKAKLKAANGIIVGTPEYHGSLSGVLKNASIC